MSFGKVEKVADGVLIGTIHGGPPTAAFYDQRHGMDPRVCAASLRSLLRPRMTKKRDAGSSSSA